MRIKKSQGTTKSEAYLASLCEKTFLGLWSYPNVFRDQGKRGAGGDGKELCDLLVVCGPDIIVFSNKSRSYPNTGDPKRDWIRWYKGAVHKSAIQLHGAERWIRQFPERLYVDRSCQTPLPIQLPVGRPIRVHRVAVALGSHAACRRHLRGSGSLVLAPNTIGNDHINPQKEGFHPFHVGIVAPSKGFVHVFDDITLDVILRQLDTVSDFLRYLRIKEEAIQEQKLALVEGEENLLSNYLSRVDATGQHIIELPPADKKLIIEDGHWLNYIGSREYVSKKEADQRSYLWDGIISEFTGHAFAGTLREGGEITVSETEQALRVMALEPRFRRRILANAFYGLQEVALPEKISTRHIPTDDPSETIYVLVVMPDTPEDEEGYRRARAIWLENYCFVTAWHYRCTQVLGIATELGIAVDGRSYDICLYRPDEWTEELQLRVERAKSTMGIFSDLKKTFFEDHEYPPSALSAPGFLGMRDTPSMKLQHPTPPLFPSPARIGRNERCPCGSGLKFKRCCSSRVPRARPSSAN